MSAPNRRESTALALAKVGGIAQEVGVVDGVRSVAQVEDVHVVTGISGQIVPASAPSQNVVPCIAPQVIVHGIAGAVDVVRAGQQ